MPRPSAALLLLAPALASGGCSWAFMTRAPLPVAAPTYPVECTASRAAPVLDTICAGYFVANGIALAGIRDCDTAYAGQSCYRSGEKGGAILLSAGLAAVCVASAFSGYTRSTECEEVRSANALCIVGNEASCRQLNPSWSRPPGWNPAASQAQAPLPAPEAPGPYAPQLPPSSPPAVAPTPAWQAAPALPGCGKDTDCKGDRICDGGRCVTPPGK